MKNLFIMLATIVIIFAISGCVGEITVLDSVNIEPEAIVSYEQVAVDISDEVVSHDYVAVSPSASQTTQTDHGGDFDIRRFRPLHYNMSVFFAEFVGRENYRAWRDSRSEEERESENIAVSFIRHFNVTKEDFTRLNYEALYFVESLGRNPSDSSSFEIYPVDLIFTFDNELINRYFLWENTPVAREFGLGMEIGNHRHLFYNMPAPFVNLVGREEFIEWRHNRSEHERTNENIAVSFIRDFNISREDFDRANNEMQLIWERDGFTAAFGSEFEIYSVDLIFSASNAEINEFFLWENSQAVHEQSWSAADR